MDYYQTMREEYIHKAMYPVDRRVDYFPKKNEPSNVKIEPKAPCEPVFVTRIEGNAVEEGARVFFEGIVKAQPHPSFTWYFDDEKIIPGRPGWEEAEIHHSKKMSTLILKYTREHHMGKYSLLAQNRLGHSICSCDLIVRKKQFPPVFWKRLTDMTIESGLRYVMEVEVGGWPVPEVYWYKNDEIQYSRKITENYNGFFNAYVPEKKIQVVQIDQIRHAIVFNKLSESDYGKYTVYAKNPLGEAVCEAEIEIIPGESFEIGNLYIPELWKTGKRLTWKDEDERAKKFVGYSEPELSEEDIKDMIKRVASTPLPKSLEYLATLPDYIPDYDYLKGVIPMPFKPDPDRGTKLKSSTIHNVQKPSKFVPGKIEHRGYICDSNEKIPLVWICPSSSRDHPHQSLKYRIVNYPDYPYKENKPKEIRCPPCPHEWESHEKIEALYKVLAEMRDRNNLDSFVPPMPKKSGKKTVKFVNEERNSFSKENKKRIKQAKVKESLPSNEEWKEILDKNAAGSQSNAQDFTEKFMKEISEKSSSEKYQENFTETASSIQNRLHKEENVSKEKNLNQEYVPIRSKIQAVEDLRTGETLKPDEENTEEKSREYIPVREKVKMIAQQQEAIIRKEEIKKMEDLKDGIVRKENEAYVPGGVRILPPSPVTVRKELSSQESSFETSAHSEFVMSTSSSSQYTEQIMTSSFAEVKEERKTEIGLESSESYHIDSSEKNMIASDKPEIPSKNEKTFSAKKPESYSSSASTLCASTMSETDPRPTLTASEKTNNKIAYRTPPSNPFQPSFYKPPPTEDPAYSSTNKPVFKQAKKAIRQRPKNIDQ